MNVAFWWPDKQSRRSRSRLGAGVANHVDTFAGDVRFQLLMFSQRGKASADKAKNYFDANLAATYYAGSFSRITVRRHSYMHGVPIDLNLSSFEGSTLIELGVGEFQIQFRFHPEGTISVEGKWELRDPAGVMIDSWARESITNHNTLKLQSILGKVVQSYSVNAPSSFSLRFNTGHVLTILDDSDQYESFSVGGVYV